MYQPEIICLLEKKNGVTLCDRIREQVRMENPYYVNLRGMSGGLTLWWRDGTDIIVRTATHNILKCEMNLRNQLNPSLMTWVYADVDPQKRRPNWDDLRNIGRGHMVAWACMDDFNAINHEHEKEEGRQKTQRKMDEFN